MFVLHNPVLNRFFKHPKVGVWWTCDRDEAEDMLSHIKECVKATDYPELAENLAVVEIDDPCEVENA